MVRAATSSSRERPGGLLGVVLCGGRSARMGTDKARIEIEGSTLLERAIDTLRALTPNVVLACGASERYADLGVPLVLDRYPDAGPLAGLEAALESSHEEWLVAVACDLPRLSSDLLGMLCDRAREGDLDACYFETVKGLEPLCAMYRRTCLPSIRAALDCGERRMIAFLDHPSSRGERPRIATVRADAFADRLVNVNSPADVEALAARKARA